MSSSPHGFGTRFSAQGHQTSDKQPRHTTLVLFLSLPSLRPPPPPPSCATAFCCQHVALVDSSRADSDQAWVDLPSRHMAWMPVFNHGTGRWGPEWVCLRWKENLTGHHPLLQNVPVVPVCPLRGARVLAVDVAYGERGWVCCHGHPVLPGLAKASRAGPQFPLPLPLAAGPPT